MQFGLRDILFAEAGEVSNYGSGIDGAVAFLSEGEDSSDEAEAESEPVESEEESEPEAEETEELAAAEETEDKDEKVSDSGHPGERPSLDEIEKKFPGFLKKFPAVRGMYFRDKEYGKLFSSVDEAKSTVSNNEAFETLQNDLMTGDGRQVLSAMKETDPKQLEKFASRLVQNLYETHPPAFARMFNPLVQDLARQMYQAGIQRRDDNLKNSALFLSEYVFNTPDVAEGKKNVGETETAPDQGLKAEREAFEAEKHQTFFNSVEESASSQLRKLIDTDKIPESLTPFMRKTVIAEISKEIGNVLKADKEHLKYMDSLWKKAKESGRNQQAKDRILSAYLSRVKPVIPSIRARIVSEALGQRVRTASEAKQKTADIESRSKGNASGKVPAGNRGGYDPKKIDYKKTSAIDIINDNITYR